MSDLDTHALDRIIVTRMVGIALVCASFFLTSLYVQTTILDFKASKANNEKLTTLLDDWTANLHLDADDFAAESAKLRKAPPNQLETNQSTNERFDWIVILDPDGKILTEYNLPQHLNDPNYFAGLTFEPALMKSVETTLAGSIERNGSSFLASIRSLSSAEQASLGDYASSVLVTGKNLDENALGQLGDLIKATNIAFSTDSGHQGNGLIGLQGPLGFAGNLIWEAELKGTVIREVVMPWLLMICATFVMLTAWMARNFRMMSERMTRIHAVATTDQLTGVANRTALNEILKRPTMQNALEEGRYAVISLDLNDFKQLNDKLGHDAGDTALRITAERISNSLRRNDSVVRMGGDEFLCLVFDNDPAEVAYKIVDRLLSAFSVPMVLGEHREIVTPSIGVAISDPGEKWDAVRGRSDAAMYRAKREHPGNNFCFS